MVDKHCDKCDMAREGLGVENANIIITRTGNRTYSFSIDTGYIGDLSVLPSELQEIMFDKEGALVGFELSFNWETQATTSNLWDISGVTMEQLAKLGGDASPRVAAPRPSSPLRLSSTK